MRNWFLIALGTWVLRFPGLILVLALTSATASGYYAAKYLILNADTDDLIARDRSYRLQYDRFVQEFGDLEYLLVVVDSQGNPQQAEACIDALYERIQAIPGIPEIHAKVTPEEQFRLLSRAMPLNDLQQLATLSPALNRLSSASSLPDLLNQTQGLIEQTLADFQNLTPDQLETQTQTFGFLLQLLHYCTTQSLPLPSPPIPLLQNFEPQYLKSPDSDFYFLYIMPQKDFGTLAVIEEPLRQIRKVLEETRPGFPDIEIGLTGKPVLQADEMDTTNRDMTRSASVAFVLCALLFLTMMGGPRYPLLTILAFACGGAWTYGAATLLVGQLNLLSLVFMLVLIGVGLDYGVHLISRYRESRQTQTLEEAIQTTMQTAVRGNITGATTSSIVFLAAFFTHFQGLRELGIIAGLGLLLCLLAMTLVLPSVIVLWDRTFGFKVTSTPQQERIRSLSEPSKTSHFSILFKYPKAILTSTLAVTLGLALLPGKPRFEHNLLKLQAVGLESVDWEHRILNEASSATWFAGLGTSSLQELESLRKTALSKESIGATQSLLDLIPPDLDQRLPWRRMLHHPPSPTPPTSQPPRFLASDSFHPPPPLAPLIQQLNDIQRSISTDTENNQPLPRFMTERFNACVQSLNAFLEGDELPLHLAIPKAFRQQYLADSGRFLFLMFAKNNVWELSSMERFINDLRSVDPSTTGVPMTHYESILEMQHAFLQMALLSLGSVGVLVWIDFRRIKDVLLTFVPLLIGLIWTAELMAFFNISYNLANFFAIPILIGLSIDSGVHLLHRYREDPNGTLALGSTLRAIFTTAMTTIIGFGSLVMAHHQGLQSLGWVMAIGTASCLFASLVVLPALLTLFSKSQASS